MPWTAVRHASIRHPAVLELSGTRRVIRDQYGYLMYLGERVVRQYRWDQPVRVPQPPPRYARMPSRMAFPDFEVLRAGIPVDELFDDDQDYETFLQTRVMTMATPVSLEVLRQRAFGDGAVGPEVPEGGGIGFEVAGEEDAPEGAGDEEVGGAGGSGGAGGASVVEEMTGGQGVQVTLDFSDFLGRVPVSGAGSSAAEDGYLRGLAEGQRLAEEALDRARELAYARGREDGRSQGVAESGVASVIIPRASSTFSWIREGMAETFMVPPPQTLLSGFPALTGLDGRSVSQIFIFVFFF